MITESGCDVEGETVGAAAVAAAVSTVTVDKSVPAVVETVNQSPIAPGVIVTEKVPAIVVPPTVVAVN